MGSITSTNFEQRKAKKREEDEFSFRNRFYLERKIFRLVKISWEVNPDRTLGFIENREELKAFCKNLNDDELSELYLICVDEPAKAKAQKLPKNSWVDQDFY